MSVTPPTAATFKTRHPEFDPVGDALVDLVLADASGFVHDTWRTVDQQPAVMALAAHMLTLEGEPQRSQGAAGGASPGSGPVRMAKVGDVQVDFQGLSSTSPKPQSAWQEDLRRTVYGQRFLTYLRRNFSGGVVV